MNHPQEWHDERRKGIGGSDISILVGTNPYRSKISLWLDKTGKTEPQEGNDKMELGKLMEDLIRQEFERRSGYTVEKPTEPFVDGICRGNIDGLISDATGKPFAVWEGKTTAGYNPDYKDGIPPYVYSQCQWYLGLVNQIYPEVDTCYISTIVYQMRCIEYKENTIKFNPKVFAHMKQTAEAFWNDYVLTNISPEPDGTEDCSKLIADKYPNSNGEEIMLDESFEELAEQRAFLKKEAKVIEGKISEIENKIKAEMKENEKALAGKYEILWKTQKNSSLDTKTLKEQNPQIYKKYLREGTNRVFKINEKGDQ